MIYLALTTRSTHRQYRIKKRPGSFDAYLNTWTYGKFLLAIGETPHLTDLRTNFEFSLRVLVIQLGAVQLLKARQAIITGCRATEHELNENIPLTFQQNPKQFGPHTSHEKSG
jgi:hypothetical protein